MIATVRDVAKASQLWALAGATDRGSCQLFECDVDHEASITVCGYCDPILFRKISCSGRGLRAM